jgi:taurine dioxygenase
MPVEIRRMGPQIGAEITGVDVKTMDERTFEAIYRAWLAYNVIVVRAQEMDMPEYLRYSRRFGPVEEHPTKSTRHPQYPEVLVLGVNKFRPDGTLDMAIYRRGAEGWHTDGSYNERPFKATQLYARAIPSRGGDTFFASTYASYDALPESLRARLRNLKGAYVYGGRKKAQALLDEADRNWKPVLHPFIRAHPETGRNLLYFDANKILYVDGLPEAASDALIEELKGYMIQPDAEYCHKWRNGDVVIWDNRCSYHKAAGDYPPEEDRIHWRVSIAEGASDTLQ